MKRSRRNERVLSGILAVLLLLSLVACDGETPPLSSTQGESERESAWWTEEETEMATQKDPYDAEVDVSVLDTGYDPAYLLLANKEHPLGSDYIPADLTRLSCHTTYEMDLDARAAAALYEMLDEMATDGLDVTGTETEDGKTYDLAVTSAYRSYRVQAELAQKYLREEMNHPDGFSEDAIAYFGEEYLRENYIDKGITHLCEEDARAVVLSYSAEPGKSEHQTGLCVDFITSDMKHSLTTVFETKPAFAWLSAHAHEFGFILRYPKGKESITGYTYEPWHYRFVGREAATEIRAAGLTLEEYLLARNTVTE